MEVTNEIQALLGDLTKAERDVVLEILESGDLSLLQPLYDMDYNEVPVTIDRFISDPRYLGAIYDGGRLIYPYWREFLHNFFHNNPNRAFEVAFSGAIGIGKSTIAAVMMTYIIYKTLCLKDPRKFYGLTGNSPIVFVVMNLTLDLAYQGLYTLVVENIKASPWFLERVEIRGKYDFSIEFREGIQLMAGSNTNHVIGKNVIVALLDEVSFSNAPKGSKNSVMDMYRSIRRRMESRFMKSGNLPGMIGLISSKNDENTFLERYISNNRHNKKTIVIDKPVYEIKPASTYIGTKFKVAVGDKTKSSFIIETDEDEKRARGWHQKIIEVPTEYRQAYQEDIEEALKEISGISAISSSKLISYPGRIIQCLDTDRRSPFMQETIHMSLQTEDTIMDYLEDLSLLRRDLGKYRFIHVDIGLKGDSLGLAVVHERKFTTVDRTSTDGTVLSFTEPIFDTDLLLRVRAESGSEIPLYKIREFILWLNKKIYRGKIKKVTFDGFQSADSVQLLSTAGIDTSILSVDRTDVPYLALRSAILEKRVTFYQHNVLVRELTELEYDRIHKKVDHPETTVDNEPGSKDVSDALCGAVYNAAQYYASKVGSSAYTQDGKLKKNMQTLALYKQAEKAKSLGEISEDNRWIL